MWVGEEYMFGDEIVWLLILYFFVSNMRRIVMLYKDAAGMWMSDMLKPYFEAFTNLVINLVLVHVLGIAGIIIATIISMAFVAFPWECKALFQGLFHNGIKGFILKMCYYACATVLVCLLGCSICNLLPGEGIFYFIIKGLLSVIIAVTGLSVLYFPLKEYKDAVYFLKNILYQKLSRKKSEK